MVQRLGKRIKELRKMKGYKTAKDFATAHNIPVAEWQSYERGEDVYIITIIGMCKVLDISLKELFGEWF